MNWDQTPLSFNRSWVKEPGCYSDPQEGLSVLSILLPFANSEISFRAATAETPTTTTIDSKMISIFLVLSQVLIYLESQSQRILDRDPPSLCPLSIPVV
jgi:hypothetical protein